MTTYRIETADVELNRVGRRLHVAAVYGEDGRLGEVRLQESGPVRRGPLPPGPQLQIPGAALGQLADVLRTLVEEEVEE